MNVLRSALVSAACVLFGSAAYAEPATVRPAPTNGPATAGQPQNFSWGVSTTGGQIDAVSAGQTQNPGQPQNYSFGATQTGSFAVGDTNGATANSGQGNTVTPRQKRDRPRSKQRSGRRAN